jgi:hypothetical protein
MNNNQPTPTRRTRSTSLATIVAVSAALIGVTAFPIDVFHGRPSPAVFSPDHPTTEVRRGRATPLGEADGIVPGGVTVFDDEIPAVANLDPDLLQALRHAATDAADEGVVFYVNSGWRSPEYQDQLLREAIDKYGSAEEAARWVATAETSLHVSGDAVDIGPTDASAWLSGYGDVYGLCQIYINEPWHFELRPEAIDHGCPPMYDDPTQDPGMRR